MEVGRRVLTSSRRGPMEHEPVVNDAGSACLSTFAMLRTRLWPSGFIEPCLPSPAERPPSGPNWIHEIKHDGFRLMARRDAVGVRLLTRNGIDWSGRFPLIAAAAGDLKVRSCLIDGEAVACDGDGLSSFDRLRYPGKDGPVSLYAFDLLDLAGRTLRREPIEVRKRQLVTLLRRARFGLQDALCFARGPKIQKSA